MFTLILMIASVGFLVVVYMLYELWAVDSPIGSGRGGQVPH